MGVPPTVLVTCGGSIQGLAILEGLRRKSNVRTIVADSSDENIGRYFANAFRRSPPLSDPRAYLEFVDSIVHSEAVDIVIPATDLDLSLLATQSDSYAEKDVWLAVSDPTLLEILLNKRATYSYFAAAGVPVLEELEPDLERPLEFSVIAKPCRGSGGKGQIILRAGDIPASQMPLERTAYFLQRYVEGAKEYSVDFAINRYGEISPLAARERVRNFNGFSILGHTAGSKSELMELGEKIARHIAISGGRGGFNLQFLEHHSQWFLIDVNPRFGTSSSLSLEMGINLPGWLLGSRSSDDGRELRLVRYIAQMSVPRAPLPVRGIVFDLDDTLIDQKAWIADKLVHLHAIYAHLLPPISEFLTGAFQILEEGNRSRLLDGVIELFGLRSDVRCELIQTYRNITPEKITIYADVLGALTEIRRRGIKTAILTDNPAASQRQKLVRFKACSGVRDLFEAVVLTDEIGRSKPDPAGFLKCSELLGLKVSDLAMVGDHLYRDGIGALQAGYQEAFLIERRGGFYNFSRVLSSELGERTHRIQSLDELLAYLPT